ncbi:hypothetical protein QYF36_005589 [Acer negundo]|nr:hypothetical protein QYF36_005589 [Acer negundo]
MVVAFLTLDSHVADQLIREISGSVERESPEWRVMAIDGLRLLPLSHSPFHISANHVTFMLPSTDSNSRWRHWWIYWECSCLPTVVCCSSRDELDAVYSAVSNLPYISFSSLLICGNVFVNGLNKGKLVMGDDIVFSWNQNVSAQSGDDSETGKDEQKSRMIIITDACLPVLAFGESPISTRFLINYVLPMKKETYMRRIANCLAADGVVINMVVGGEVVTLKSIEESNNLVIAEMP